MMQAYGGLRSGERMGSGGPRGLQNRSGPTTSGWVGSIPTRSRHRSWSGRPLKLLAGIAACCSVPLAAQTVRGTVLLPDALSPAQGILIAATDAQGIARGRALTDDHGEFRLDLSAGGRVTLRALRVGFHPTAHPPFTIAAGDTVVVRIVLVSGAVHLNAITVTRTDVCRAREDGGRRVAEVWEEARKALLVAQTRGGGRLVAEWLVYDRQLDSTGNRVRDQTVRLSRSPSDQPFRSRTADLLAREGYVVEDSGAVNFYAPDAEVLLDESFAATHCFQLASPPPDRPNLIGLRFRPVEGARRRRDIEGTFWVDRESAELRTLDFSYTNLPVVAATADPGGFVEFTRLTSGLWLVSRWQIRMPRIERVERSAPRALRGVTVVSSPLRLTGVQVTGGEVTRVNRGAEIVYRATGSALAVQVLNADGGPEPERARVRLEGTDYVQESGVDGIAHFPLVLPGRYRVFVSTAALDSARVAPARADVEVGGDSLRMIRVRLPTLLRRANAAALGLAPAKRVVTEVEFIVTDTLRLPVGEVEIVATDAAGVVHRLRSDPLGRALLAALPAGEMRVDARRPGYYAATGFVAVAEGRVKAEVLLERAVPGTVLEAVRVEAEADERTRYGAFEARRRAGAATASITRDEIERRNVVSTWQMLSTVSSVELINGPDGVLPISRRVMSMDLRDPTTPCYMRLAIDGVLLADVPANLAQLMPPPSEIHGIEVFAGPATIPSEYAREVRNMVCGLIVVWTR